MRLFTCIFQDVTYLYSTVKYHYRKIFCSFIFQLSLPLCTLLRFETAQIELTQTAQMHTLLQCVALGTTCVYRYVFIYSSVCMYGCVVSMVLISEPLMQI
jgi:hypothetical protein